MIDLCKIKEDFSGLVKEAQPWTLTQFVMWLDLKLSEFKIKGYMVLDHNIKTKPKWLIEEDKTSDVAPTPAPCRHCNKSSSQDERQFYSDIHASPSSLQQRTVTKTVTNASQQQDNNDDSNIRGEVGIIDLSHGMIQKKSNSNVPSRNQNLQIQSYRQISSHDYHMGETEKSSVKERDKRSRSDVIEIDAPSPPTKIFVPTCKSNQKTSTPISVARAMQRSKIRPSLSTLGTAVFTTTSSTTSPTFSTSYVSPTSRSAPTISASYVSPTSRSVPSSSFTNRKFALGAPPVTSTTFSSSSNISDYQNLENLIAQTVQYNETLSSQNPQTVPDHRGVYQSTPQGQRQTSANLVDFGPPQSSFIEMNVDNQQPQQSNFSENFAEQHSQISVSNNDQNLYVPSSEAVPVALHANIDVINRDNSISSVPSTSDITEIKIESDNEDASLNDSFLTDTNTSQQSLIDTMSDTSQPVQSQSQSYHAIEAGSLPKPGLVDPDTARAYQMVELVTGSGVYVFDKNIAQAFKVGTEKETGTYSGEKMARYLLNVFWSRKELVGATLSKAGRGKKILNQQIIEAILGFCLSASSQNRGIIRRALVNSVTAATCHAKNRMMNRLRKSWLKIV